MSAVGEKKSYSEAEKLLWKFATDILGKDRIDMLTEEKYAPYWKYGQIWNF